MLLFETALALVICSGERSIFPFQIKAGILFFLLFVQTDGTAQGNVKSPQLADHLNISYIGNNFPNYSEASAEEHGELGSSRR